MLDHKEVPQFFQVMAVGYSGAGNIKITTTHTVMIGSQGQTWAQLMCWPPVTGSTSDRGNVYRGIMVDIEAKGSKFP